MERIDEGQQSPAAYVAIAPPQRADVRSQRENGERLK